MPSVPECPSGETCGKTDRGSVYASRPCWKCLLKSWFLILGNVLWIKGWQVKRRKIRDERRSICWSENWRKSFVTPLPKFAIRLLKTIPCEAGLHQDQDSMYIHNRLTYVCTICLPEVGCQSWLSHFLQVSKRYLVPWHSTMTPIQENHLPVKHGGMIHFFSDDIISLTHEHVVEEFWARIMAFHIL